jgi:hypothetical protein
MHQARRPWALILTSGNTAGCTMALPEGDPRSNQRIGGRRSASAYHHRGVPELLCRREAARRFSADQGVSRGTLKDLGSIHCRISKADEIHSRTRRRERHGRAGICNGAHHSTTLSAHLRFVHIYVWPSCDQHPRMSSSRAAPLSLMPTCPSGGRSRERPPRLRPICARRYLTTLLNVGVSPAPASAAFSSKGALVAGVGFEPTTFRL